jgi:hypothetical protein
LTVFSVFVFKVCMEFQTRYGSLIFTDDFLEKLVVDGQLNVIYSA